MAQSVRGNYTRDDEQTITDVEGLAEAVQGAYTSNLDDTWGVDVYFWITKTPG